MPNGTEDQVGFFWLQSKHTYGWDQDRGLCWMRRYDLTYLVGRLRLQLLEEFLRLTLGGETHDGVGEDVADTILVLYAFTLSSEPTEGLTIGFFLIPGTTCFTSGTVVPVTVSCA
ncbi:hypothetical protein MRB53_041623 [Persea americana]|nr:hypothetical protein MRB53_041623 [Persea americana]